jgi:hypothetical protein
MFVPTDYPDENPICFIYNKWLPMGSKLSLDNIVTSVMIPKGLQSLLSGYSVSPKGNHALTFLP